MSRAEQFVELDPAVAARWSKFGKSDEVFYPQLLNISVEEVRVDYCRMRMKYKPELLQPARVVHGGAIASLLDAVIVPAVGAAYPPRTDFSTIDMHVQFLSAVRDGDVIGEGWVVRRGRSIIFCESEATSADTGKVVARSVLTYRVSL